MTFELFAATLILALALAIGYAIGAARVNWPLINWFRNHYEQCAEERVRQHTRFLIAQINLFGAAPFRYRCAVTRAGQGGRPGSRLNTQPLRGGNSLETNKTDILSDDYMPSTGARLPIERP
ncbi:MAG: hypothetical protein ICV60_05655 [Pyrinomonadaceae bacterium]|nr:hypothetical protein [Pyrinomonadaceae bacterium]